ncbi:hypothetical protein EJB05_53983, partial [Eragrostis curvula]
MATGVDEVANEWIAEHGDVGRLFLGGANIVHHMLLRAAPRGRRRRRRPQVVCAGKKDSLFARSRRTTIDTVGASAWRETAAWLESEAEEDHVFFLKKPECDNAKRFLAGA